MALEKFNAAISGGGGKTPAFNKMRFLPRRLELGLVVENFYAVG